jgi:flagellar M-ring protein FliF
VAAGAASNVPSETAAQPTSGQNTAKTIKEAETIQYDVGKVFERKVFSPWELKRISVAVMVDGSSKVVADGKGGEQKEYVPRKPEEIEKIKVVVKNAVGFNASRGDEVEVVEFPFDTSAMEKERTLMEEGERKAFWYSLATQAGMAIGVLLVLLFVLRPLIRALKGRRLPALDVPRTFSISQPSTTAFGEGPPQVRELDTVQDDPLRQGLMELATKQPTVVAQLVRAWMVKKPL